MHIQKFETKYFYVVFTVVVLLDLKTGINLITVVKNLVHAFRKCIVIVDQTEQKVCGVTKIHTQSVDV